MWFLHILKQINETIIKEYPKGWTTWLIGKRLTFLELNFDCIFWSKRDFRRTWLPWNQFFVHFSQCTVTISGKIDLSNDLDIIAKLFPEQNSFYHKSFLFTKIIYGLKNYLLSVKKSSRRNVYYWIKQWNYR